MIESRRKTQAAGSHWRAPAFAALAGMMLAVFMAGSAAHAAKAKPSVTAPQAAASQTKAAKQSRVAENAGDEVGGIGVGPMGAVPGLDGALLSIFSSLPSDGDLAHTKAAIDAAFKRDFTKVKAELSAIKDETATKLVRWYALRTDGSGADAQEIEAFRIGNPAWPGVELRARAEEMLLQSPQPAGTVKAFFAKTGPFTGPGRIALAAALAESGDTAKAQQLASSSWREDDFAAEEEDQVRARVGKLLGPADYKARADRILYADSRWEGVRSGRIRSVDRLMRFLAPEDRLKIAARMAVYRCTKKGCMGPAKHAMSALPKSATNDWGTIYHKVQMLRRSGDSSGAIKLLLGAPGDGEDMISPDDWWVERRVNIYSALDANDPAAAYKLAATHGPVSVNPLKEAEFMAGWIALRFLKDAPRAEQHFLAMRKAADGPISKAQADYWLGRTYDVLGDRAKTVEHYKAASLYYFTFYGQVARFTLDPKAQAIAIPALHPASAEAARAFAGRDVIRAAIIARKAGLPDVMRVLLSDVRDKARTQEEFLLLAELATSLGDVQMAVRTGKTAMEHDFDLAAYAYPVEGLPKFKPLRPLPEMAIFYAIARQESEFNTMTVSGAGARGVLQVMPDTARHVCGQYRIKCDIARLTSDPSYNATLATAYIADRHDDFGGSYVLAFAGYNAGPGRAREWIAKNGDPRDPNVDPIDWIEKIHILETRDYVKKVLANVQVYRARLGDEANALQIGRDLVRPRKAALAASN